MPGAVLRLKRGRDRARVHPWIFKGDVADVTDVAPGSAVTVVDAAGRFVGIFFDAMRRYGLRGARAVHAARGLFSTVHGFIVLEQAGTFGLPVSTDASFRWLIRQYASSLAHGRRRKSGRRHAAPARP